MFGIGRGLPEAGFDLEARDARLQLTALVSQLPVGLGEPLDPLDGSARTPERQHGDERRNAGENGR